MQNVSVVNRVDPPQLQLCISCPADSSQICEHCLAGCDDDSFFVCLFCVCPLILPKSVSTAWQVVMIVCLFVFLCMSAHSFVKLSQTCFTWVCVTCVWFHPWLDTPPDSCCLCFCPFVSHIAALLPKMGFSGCGPTIAALLPKMGFRWLCDPHCRIIAKNGILWVVSMDALRLAKMGFSGCVPHCSTIAKDGILQFCPH